MTLSAVANSVSGTVRPSALGSLEIKNEFESRRLLHREVAGLFTAQNAIHIGCSASIFLGAIAAVERHQPTLLDDNAPAIDGRQAVTRRQLDYQIAIRGSEAVREQIQTAIRFAREFHYGAFEFEAVADLSGSHRDAESLRGRLGGTKICAADGT
jgi:hypothetical protein